MFKQRKQEIRPLMFVIGAGSQVYAGGSFPTVSCKARGHFAPLAP